MRFRLATPEDIDAVMAIVAEVVEEMNAVGNFQWDDHYPDAARFLLDIDSASLHVADDNGLVVGFVTVDREEPAGYAGLPWNPGPFVVVHRLAVAQKSRGAGVATFMEECVCRASRDAIVVSIKVDTYSTNRGMQAFLASRGYRKVGEMAYRGKPLPFYCYEKLL